jgi:Ca2+-binding EF-hand superfamily protein
MSFFSTRKKDLTIEQKNEIKDCFDIFCSSYMEETNLIKMEDLKVAMISLGLRPTQDEFERIVLQIQRDYVDPNETVTKELLTYEEFYEIISLRLLSKDPSQECKKIFELLCDHERKINAFKFNQIANRFKETLTDDEINNIISAGDLDLDGKVNESDFMRIMKRVNYY